MTDPRELRAEEILADVLDLPPADRPAAVDRACGDDADLRARVEGLLAAAAAAGDFMGGPTVTPPADDVTVGSDGRPGAAPPAEGPGTRIGRYRLLEQIGEGGFGVVFRAEQEEPVRRQVAVKVIKLGMDTREVVARFEAERQALALMDHPSIAKVFDAGSTDAGRPYFVMELVRGSPITDYCDKRHMPPAGRVALLAEVCRAVQHAHSKGVIHRDLKPTNVLVTTADDGRPVPKVIDFGIAKATRGKLTDRTLFTAFRQLIGTPQYMSPEQADSDGTDVDTRTDVYSLGVVLYELLVGTTPVDAKQLRSAAYEAMRRMIREQDPPKPSTRLSGLGQTAATVATNRGTDARRLAQSVRGELDWIVMRALEKDRARRYDTVAALADDLNRYLAGEAVLAGPVSGAYRARKFVRRHRAGLGVAVLVGLAVMAGVVGLSVGLVIAVRGYRAAVIERAQADAARAAAEAERDNARAVTEFLTDDMLAHASPRVTADKALRDTLVATLVQPAADHVGQRFAAKPRLEAAIRLVIAQVYSELGRDDLAEPQAARALAVRRSTLGPDAPDTLKAEADHAVYLRGQFRLDESERLLKGAWDHDARVLGPDDLETVRAMAEYAESLVIAGRAAAAEPIARRALDARRRALGDAAGPTLQSVQSYAGVLQRLGRYAEAEALVRQSWDRQRQAVGENDLDAVGLMTADATLLALLRRASEAEQLQRRAYERYAAVFGPDHPRTIGALSALAETLTLLGRPADALPLATRAWDVARRTIDPSSFVWQAAAIQRADAADKVGRPADAEPVWKALYEQMCRLPGPDDGDSLRWLGRYASSVDNQGRHADAQALFQRQWDRLRATQGGDSRAALEAAECMARVLHSQGKDAAADPIARQVLDAEERTLGPTDSDTLMALNTAADIASLLGRAEEAQRSYGKLWDRRRQLTGGPDAVAATALVNQGTVLFLAGRGADGLAAYRHALATDLKSEGLPRTMVAEALGVLVVNIDAPTDTALKEVADLLRRAIAARRAAKPSDEFALAGDLSTLGRALAKLGQFPEAETNLRAALELRGRQLGPTHPATGRTAAALAYVLDHTGRQAEAARIRATAGLVNPAAGTRPAR